MHKNDGNSANQRSSIEVLLRDYFDGLYMGDTETLARVFHPEARYVSASQGSWVNLSMADYFERVRLRQAPAHTDQQRMDKIIDINMAGPTAAVAKVNCAINGLYFTDLLSLVCLESRWLIIHKLFDSQPLATT